MIEDIFIGWAMGRFIVAVIWSIFTYSFTWANSIVQTGQVLGSNISGFGETPTIGQALGKGAAALGLQDEINRMSAGAVAWVWPPPIRVPRARRCSTGCRQPRCGW
jgi:hypothetical protein